jgi:6-phosphogluconolactonase (cycloisomerase 2 family)
VLTLNGGADLAVSGSGNFTFPDALTSGANYSVAVKNQPVNPHQTCVATSASGVIGSSSINNVAVSCSTNNYTVGGAVSGLTGSGLVLSLNDDVELAVGVSGNFTFPGELASGSSYAVTVKTQPTTPHQTCTVANSSGTVAGSVISNVSVSCSTTTFAVGGSVSGLVGTGLVLRSNGTNLPVSANGAFAFPSPLPSGSNYSVTIFTQPVSPRQTCVATNSSGVIGGSAPNVSVNCTTDKYSVGGSVSGLTGTGLVLQLNGAQDLPVSSDGSFLFPSPLLSGQSYNVTVSSQTATHREVCSARNATGSGTTTNITSVRIECAVVPGFVYAVGADNKLLQFGIHPATGALLPLGTAATVGPSTFNMVAAPDHKVLYASSAAANTVQAFSVDPDKGALSSLGAPVSTGGSRASQLAITSSGEFLYVANNVSGTISLFSIDSVTGELSSQGVAATATASGFNANQHIAITPDGAFLYLLSYAGPVAPITPASLTVYSIDAATGALTAGATIAPVDATGLTIDPMGRFLYLRNVVAVPAMAETTLYPYSIDPATGAVTPLGINLTVSSNGGSMLIDGAGHYAYLLGSFNLTPADNHIDTFSIDQTTGALTTLGTPVVLPGLPPNGLASDAAGKFLFVANRRLAGTFNPNEPVNGSTLAIEQTGPNAGRPSAPGAGAAMEASFTAIVVIE